MYLFPFVFIALLGINVILLSIVLIKGSKKNEPHLNVPSFEKTTGYEKLILLELQELKNGVERLTADNRRDLLQLREEFHVFNEKAKQYLKEEKVENNLFITERYKEIFDLYDKGLSAEQIAKELEKGLGEISFILQLANLKQQ